MKTNLKTFPDVHEWYYRKKVHDWKEAFEKEVTAKLSNAEFSETKSIKNDTIIEVLKEILGETS